MGGTEQGHPAGYRPRVQLGPLPARRCHEPATECQLCYAWPTSAFLRRTCFSNKVAPVGCPAPEHWSARRCSPGSGWCASVTRARARRSNDGRTRTTRCTTRLRGMGAALGAGEAVDRGYAQPQPTEGFTEYVKANPNDELSVSQANADREMAKPLGRTKVAPAMKKARPRRPTAEELSSVTLVEGAGRGWDRGDGGASKRNPSENLYQVVLRGSSPSCRETEACMY